VTALVLATRNEHKLIELRRLLGEAGLAVEVLGIADLPDSAVVPDVAETGETFTANALLKAHAVATATGMPAVADDSGLAVDALNGMPGILSARWSGRHGDDAANLRLVLDQLSDVPQQRRSARFVCAAAVALPDGTERVQLGEVHGRLTDEPMGSNGFGYDPIFVPDGEHQTFGQLPAATKDAMSHRSRALTALVPAIRELTGSR
jgi:XTP/dITP diphosphohydrolase